MYQCGSCDQEFEELAFEMYCPNCGSGNWIKGCIDEDECTCPPVDITWAGGEVCPSCKRRAQKKYGDTIPVFKEEM